MTILLKILSSIGFKINVWISFCVYSMTIPEDWIPMVDTTTAKQEPTIVIDKLKSFQAA